jgi:carboxyl-terminal processing protease
VYQSKGYDVFDNGNTDIVILVDGGSASASEIFSGALHEYKKATLVGVKTFGKGSVQELFPITADTSLKVTVAKWLTPFGVSISEKGITPDYIVPITTAQAKAGIDPQMEKAISILSAEN